MGDNVLLEPTLNTVKGLMIMDNNGVRILSKYYDPEIFPNVAAQKNLRRRCSRRLTRPMLR